MQARELMSSDIELIASDTPIEDAARRMRGRNS
jgi:CBS domain-containing protein